MQSGIFFTLLYQPFYNGFVFLISVIPGGNVGVAIILLTIAVRLLLLPLSHRSVMSQAKMRAIAPHIEKLKEKHKDNKQEQAMKIMELYREHGVNPFSGCLILLVQLPVILALYYVFMKGIATIHTEALYSFIQNPGIVSDMFLGVLLTGKSAILALIAGLTQYFQIKFSIPPLPEKNDNKAPTFKDDFARSLNLQMRFMLPLIVIGVSYVVSAAVALYWITSNLFSIAQELYVKRKVSAITAA